MQSLPDRGQEDAGTALPSPPPSPRVGHVWGVTFLALCILLAGDTTAFKYFGNFAIVFMEVTIVIPAAVYLRVAGYSFTAAFRLKPVERRIIAWSVVVGITLPVTANALDTAIDGAFPMPESLRQAMERLLVADGPEDLALIAAGLVFAAAVCEELLFRGFLQTALERRYGPARAVALASLAFSTIHVNPWWFVSILFVGVIFGILAYTSGSVFPGMIVHGMNNGLALLIVNAQASGHFRWMAKLDAVSLPVTLVSTAVLTAVLVRFFKYGARPGGRRATEALARAGCA